MLRKQITNEIVGFLLTHCLVILQKCLITLRFYDAEGGSVKDCPEQSVFNSLNLEALATKELV